MTEQEHDLLVLVFGLAQLKDEELIRRRFIECLNRSCPGMQVSWSEAGQEPRGQLVEVATAKRHLGWLRVEGRGLCDGAELLVRVCAHMLALILIRREAPET
jgi:hypothetical protein